MFTLQKSTSFFCAIGEVKDNLTHIFYSRRLNYDTPWIINLKSISARGNEIVYISVSSDSAIICLMYKIFWMLVIWVRSRRYYRHFIVYVCFLENSTKVLFDHRHLNGTLDKIGGTFNYYLFKKTRYSIIVD